MIKYIHSATVWVNDQDKAINFYTNTLGFEKLDDTPMGQGGRWVVVAPPGEKVGLALMRPQDSNEPTVKPGGYTGISMIADDLKRSYEEMAAKGVKFDSPPQQMPWGALATWFSDPDGNSFFLTEGPR